MPPDWRPAAEGLVSDVQHIFDARLRSVIAYGPAVDGVPDAPVACLVLVDDLRLEDLEHCAARWRVWREAGLATPLVLPAEEFGQSLDVFPLEYGEIIRAHERVHGPDPFDALQIDAHDLRRACEQQAKSHLLHLRERYMESAGRLGALSHLVAESAPAFGALLRNVARLGGVVTRDRDEATQAGARLAGLEPGLVSSILRVDEPGGLASSDPARLFPDYLAAMERLAHVVNAWSES
ncbi:MAG: hypothetical protein AB7G23_01940 [Vicinamibacterales bacterium]